MKRMRVKQRNADELVPNMNILVIRRNDFGSQIKSVCVPASVKEIGKRAFAGSSIVRVTFAKNSKLWRIRKAAFSGSSLQVIEIPKQVRVIPVDCFSDCVSLRAVLFDSPSSLTYICRSAFARSGIKSFLVPATVKTIGSFCFRGSKLEDIVFEANSSLTKIEDEAFRLCKIKRITIPRSIESIGVSCFVDGCLRTVSFEDPLPENAVVYTNSDKSLTMEPSPCCFIGSMAFRWCYISEITIPATVVHLYNNCFDSSSISSVVFENGSVIRKFGMRAFAHCKQLSRIVIPASVEVIGSECFIWSGLSSIEFAEPSNLKIIEFAAFQQCRNLCYIEIPASVEEIESSCFAYNDSLPTVIFRDSEHSHTRKIGNLAFKDCGLTSIVLPRNLEYLGAFCFGTDEDTWGLCDVYHEFSEIVIPKSVKSIGEHCFAYCKKLKRVLFEKDSCLEELGSYAFFGTGLVEICIPASVVKIRAGCFGECDLLSTIMIEEGSQLDEIGDFAFFDLRQLTSIQIPASVTTIGKCCFGCRKAGMLAPLASVTFMPGSRLRYIGPYAFSRTSITSIIIPASVEVISPYCFTEMSNLKSIEFEQKSSLVKIGDNAFYGNKYSRVDIQLPASLTEIGENCFTECPMWNVTYEPGSCPTKIGSHAVHLISNLVSVTIPESVERIEDKLFIWCKIQYVSFAGNRVRAIGAYAFAHTSLEAAEIPASVERLGAGCFSYTHNLGKVVFPAGSKLKRFEPNLFDDSLCTDIIIPAKVEVLCQYSLANCTIENITFEKGSRLRVIENNAFHGSWIKKLQIPAGIKNIGKMAFAQAKCQSGITGANGKRYALKPNGSLF